MRTSPNANHTASNTVSAKGNAQTDSNSSTEPFHLITACKMCGYRGG